MRPQYVTGRFDARTERVLLAFQRPEAPEAALKYLVLMLIAGMLVLGLAGQVAVSPSYLFRLFKKKMQVTPMHYRNTVRIDKAKLLLADQQCNQ